MRPDQQKTIEAFVRLVRAAEALDNCVSRTLLVEGLTSSQFSALLALRIHGPLAQRDIAKHLLKSGGNITMVVDNLEREGLVVRDRDTGDRRVIYVSLTPEGRERLDRIYPDHLQKILDTMAPLSAGECETLIDLLCTLHPDNVVIGKTPATAATLEEITEL